MYAPEHWSGSCRTGSYGPAKGVWQAALLVTLILWLHKRQYDGSAIAVN